MNRFVCIKLDDSAVSVETLQTVAARCQQFTPLVGIDPDVFPQSVLLDITRVVDLFGGEAALFQRIAGELRAEGWQFRAAVAGTPGAAWALAGYGKSGKWGVDGHAAIPSQATGLNAVAPCSSLPAPRSSPLNPLPLSALRLPEPIIALLHSLGVWRIEQLAALPRRELSSRFGPELLDCLDRVTGRLPEPLPAWDPLPSFEVHWSAEFPTTRRETIEAALEHLVRRLAVMLTRASRGAMRLECRLTCQGKGKGDSPHLPERPEGCCAQMGTVPFSFSLGLFRPTAWAKHLFDLLQVRFESLQLPGAVEAIRLAATTAPLELRQQEMFAGKGRVQPYHLAGLIDRLSNRLGQTRVVRVRLIPDAQPELACHYSPLVETTARSTGFSRKRNGFPPKGGTTNIRPLRLLIEPLRLSSELGEQFSLAGRQQRIVRRIGPERIETGWWRGHIVARDYYRIETATGCWYWVFRRLPDGPWFLHGIFD